MVVLGKKGKGGLGFFFLNSAVAVGQETEEELKNLVINDKRLVSVLKKKLGT